MFRALAASLNSGASYALFGVCIVITYRMAGTLNFSATAVGAISAFSMLALVADGVPIAQAAGVALAVGSIIGATMGGVFAIWFRDHGPLTRSTVTIATLVGLLALGFRIFGDQPRVSRPFLPGRYTELADVRITHHTILAVVVALIAAIATSLVLKRTRVGILLRAMAQDPVTAEINGVPVAALTTVVWGIAGGLSALGAILVGPGRPAAFAPLVFLLLPGLASALAGRIEQVWPTFSAGFVIAFLETYSARFSSISRYRGTVPVIFILVLLIWQRRDEVWDDAR